MSVRRVSVTALLALALLGAGRLAPLRPQMKVLYMSGHTEDAIIVRDIRRVRAHFLPKPFQPHDLGRKVREVLDAEAP